MIDPSRTAALESLRQAYVAKTAQQHVADECVKDIGPAFAEAIRTGFAPLTTADVEARRREAVECMSFEEARRFAQQVWALERPGSVPVQVYRQEDLNRATRRVYFSEFASAEARWAYPYADQIGVDRDGVLAGTVGLVPYIDVTDEALEQLTLLHEVAHLLVDTDTVLQGHNGVWASRYADLIATYVDRFTASTWEFQWEWWTKKAAEHVAVDPQWMLETLDLDLPTTAPNR